jgi:hypothetical protein
MPVSMYWNSVFSTGLAQNVHGDEAERCQLVASRCSCDNIQQLTDHLVWR